MYGLVGNVVQHLLAYAFCLDFGDKFCSLWNVIFYDPITCEKITHKRIDPEQFADIYTTLYCSVKLTCLIDTTTNFIIIVI